MLTFVDFGASLGGCMFAARRQLVKAVAVEDLTTLSARLSMDVDLHCLECGRPAALSEVSALVTRAGRLVAVCSRPECAILLNTSRSR